MMRASLFQAATILCAALILGSGGCGQNSTVEEEHLEHHIPEHKPPDFAAAVKSLDERLTRLRPKLDHGVDVRLDQEFVELADVVRWLPELAGDSDMTEDPWNQVHKISKQLAAGIQRRPAPAIPSAEEQQSVIKELTALAPRPPSPRDSKEKDHGS